ncbi:hypothetical protein [Comamonas sp.]|uniref:hypothetical protein n=1 Tax=Comamonas sp. TaxID=34028 RepID=UPI0025BD3866|nr:hypothetical protein [Comamonas sp.]
MWARIENNIAVELSDLDPEGRYHPSLIWVPCATTVRQGDLYDGSVFLSPEPESTPALSACTPAQGLVALFALKGITEESILAVIESIPNELQRYTARIGYQRATNWERNSPTMQIMAQLLQLTDSDLDELFAYAVGVAV